MTAWNDAERDAIALIIARAEDDRDAMQAIVNAYRGSSEAAGKLLLAIVDCAQNALAIAVRVHLGLGPGDEIPDGAVPELLRSYLAATP